MTGDTYPGFDSETRVPAPLPPPLSCDSQVHVFGDPARYPLRAGGSYVPAADATVEEALRMHRRLGIERGVIVQSTAHGTDHRILLDALGIAGPSYRGIAIVDDSVSDKELRRLHEAGVRGARFNFWSQLNFVPTPETFLRSIDRIKDMGWHVKIHSAGTEWLALKGLLAKIKIPAIIDHLGHVELEEGVDQPTVKMLLDLLARDNWGVTISNFDRLSGLESGWRDALPLARRLAEAAPDRAIWCTDWPHVKYGRPTVPNDADLLEFLYRVAPDPVQRRKILVDNPARLFGF